MRSGIAFRSLQLTATRCRYRVRALSAPSVPATDIRRSVVLLTDIASHGLPMVFYSGNADAVVAHRGTEGE